MSVGSWEEYLAREYSPVYREPGQYVIVKVNLRRGTILHADHVSRRESSGLEAAVTAKVSRRSGQ